MYALICKLGISTCECISKYFICSCDKLNNFYAPNKCFYCIIKNKKNCSVYYLSIGGLVTNRIWIVGKQTCSQLQYILIYL